ncbi:HET-domain-containing protein [Lophium mytilinum]|uniref:HET-domain-containing protein n=1 Tax=Lophium mytilinum TaxID=390894 RepID=A0A6A6QZW2_9PEZI|nr:HET-domain-containing protein [Lophium mytilinum]
MANCKQHHKACRIPDLTFKPTRLIDVGRAEEGRGPHLMRPKDAVQYAALSYCWGPKSDVQSVLKTKKTNIDHYMTNIPLQLLPQTIQDAIKLCQGINIRYLWVDSLCILQDDKDDWSRESGLMRHIYYNSYLTITAAYPDSCKKGFLGKQSLGERGWQRRFRAKDEFDEVSDKFCIRLGSTKSATDEDDSPLSKRGWTLQESILPICKIIFNGEEMKWTCNEETFCECGHLIGHHEEDFPDLKGAESPIVIGLPGGQSPHLRAWIQVVREYSNRKLTEPMDKLSAVSGLAQFFQEANTPEQEKSDTYLAGLWRDNLQFWLTWRVDSLREYTHSRPLPYRAPTWSWASVDGPVQYHDIDNSGELQPCDFNIHEWRSNPAPPGNDRTGAVVSAHLLVSGLFAPVQLVVEDTHSFLHPEPFFQECVYQLFGDGTGGVQVLHLITSPLYQESKYPSFAARGVHLIRGRNFRMHDVCVDIPMAVNLRKDDTCYTCWHQGSGCDVCSFDVNPQFFCLKVCRQRYDGPESSLVYSLILKRSFTVKDAFERVGMGCWLLDSNDEGPWKGAERATIKLV